MQFNPLVYTALPSDDTVAVTATRRGPADAAVTARLSVLHNGVYTGQGYSIAWASGSVDPISVDVSLQGLGPSPGADSSTVHVALGSVTGVRASALASESIATITIAPATPPAKALHLILPGAGIVWGTAAASHPLLYSATGFAAPPLVEVRLLAENADGSHNATWSLGNATAASASGVSTLHVQLPTTGLLASPVPQELWFRVQLLELQQVQMVAVNATSQRFRISSSLNPAQVTAVSWASTTGTTVAVTGEPITVSWTLSAPPSPGAHAQVVLMYQAPGSAAPAMQVATLCAATAACGSALAVNWTVPASVSPSPTTAGTAGFTFQVTYLTQDSASTATSSPPFAIAAPAAYHASSWSACSEACGEGNRTRSVECVETAAALAGGGSPLVAGVCAGPAPAALESCFVKPCLNGSLAYRVASWAPCPVPCGGGSQAAVLQCVNSTGAVVASSLCAAAAVVPPQPTTRACNGQPCESYSWSPGPWQPCSAPCGGSGHRLREVQCVGSFGSVDAQAVACAGQAKPALREACNAQACPAGFRWQTSAWRACSVACGSGTTSRTATCVNSDGTPAPSAASCSEPQPALTRACNTQPCSSGAHRWVAGTWSSCSVACGGGTRSRVASCVDGTGKPVSASMCSAAATPVTSAGCNLDTCDPCVRLNNTCGAPGGQCVAGSCVCSAGHGGPFCRASVTQCSTGVLDRDGGCCGSALASTNGTCCGGSSPVLDRDGMCCTSGSLDECGQCDGASILDSRGSCCASAVLDAAGRCCASGEVDSCGVCDGSGFTCGIAARLSLRVDSAAAADLEPPGSLAWWVPSLRVW